MNFRLVGRVPNVLLHMAEQAELLTKAMDTVERQDATIIGGSFAGLSSATYIARARRTVCIIDI